MNVRQLSFGVIAALGLSLPALAADISGELNVTGSVQIKTGIINFFPVAQPTGNFVIPADGPETGFYVGLQGSTGVVKDLDFATEPVNTALNVPDFVTFTAAPTVHFTLTLLQGGTFGSGGCSANPADAAPGQKCTPDIPVLSPFNLSNLTSSSSTAYFGVVGTAFDDSDPTKIYNVVGTFSTQFTTRSFEQLLQTVNGGGAVNTTYAAQFEITPQSVPEPSSQVLLGLGGVLLAGSVVLRKRLRRV